MRPHRRVIGSVLAINFAGWALFLLLVLPRHRELGIGLGAALTAWTLGLRHGFDADHIASIDNATRKLMAEGRESSSTGFFFALGHASVVMLVGAAITLLGQSVFTTIVAPDGAFDSTSGTISTLLSGLFLLVIAALNLGVLAGIVKAFRAMRGGHHSETELEALLDARGGVMYRLLGRVLSGVRRPAHMFFVGFVFGISFDTATEVLLLAGTAAAATQGLPFYAVLCLPLFFAGGLTLSDSADGIFMSRAYGWAFARPVRKVYYNLVITGLSVAVAFLIGGAELIGLASAKLGWHGWLADAASGLDLNTLGLIVVGLFAGVWAVALAVWHLGDVERRWAS